MRRASSDALRLVRVASAREDRAEEVMIVCSFQDGFGEKGGLFNVYSKREGSSHFECKQR
jgi:hypothetical protein